MNMLPIVGFLVIGVIAGLFAGLFGVGGGIIVVLALVSFLQVPHHTANGISLVALILPVGLLGVIEYYRAGKISISDMWSGLIIAGGLFVGTLLGSKIAVNLSSATLRRAFAVFLIFVGVKLFLKR